MQRKLNLLTVSLALVAISLSGLFAGQALAQRDQPYRLSDRDLERIIRTIEKQADTFRKSLDDALDKSRFDGQRREDEINAFVREFDRETKRLHEHFDDHKSTRADVQSILDRAVHLERFMKRNRLTTRAQNDWTALKVDLDLLARTYNVTWGWDARPNGNYVPPRTVPVELPLLVIINIRNATERRGRRISLARDGRAEVSVGNSLTTRYVDHDLAERLFADLVAARPLSQLSVDEGCGRNTSLERTTFVTFGSERTPELSCLVGPRAEVLREDVAAITSMLNLR